MSRVTQIISQLFGIPTQQNQKLTHSWEEVPVCTIIWSELWKWHTLNYGQARQYT